MVTFDWLFNPSSIAIVGASSRENSSGYAVLSNLIKSRYQGEIIPINQNRGEILGYQALRSLSELSKPPELVVIVVKPDKIIETMKCAASIGSKNFVLLPGGFSEVLNIGEQRNIELEKIISQYKLNVIGPNCAGFWLKMFPK